MKRILLFALLLSALQSGAAQRYIIYFTDKGLIDESKFNIADVLSPEAIERRTKMGIGFDHYDIPVSENYINTLQQNGVSVLQSSRWLNAVIAETNLDPEAIHKLVPNIARITMVLDKPANTNKFAQPATKPASPQTPQRTTAGRYNYGQSAAQTGLYSIAHLHDQGYTGAGITIAFLDAGFANMNNNPGFDSTFSKGRVKAVKDFWATSSGTVYYKSSHGSDCASLVIGNIPGTFVGMAPDVNVMFAITDDYITETHQDEFNYVAGVEWAESLGTEIISVSLSYKIFDAGEGDYVYADMDGKTTISTQGARIAAAKGLILLNGADNSGFIGTPCDADSILCVGGSDMNKNYDNTSSRGPAADGRVKPDVGALTLNVNVIDPFGGINTHVYGGTSSATPQVAGIAACLKQKYPYAANYQIIRAIKESAHQYNTPDSLLGHGVPDAAKADAILGAMVLSVGNTTQQVTQTLHLYPNPAQNIIYLEAKGNIERVEVMNAMGHVVLRTAPVAPVGTIDISALPAGMYIVKAQLATGSAEAHRFVKKQ